MDNEEYLWRMVNEHMTQARHQEILRTSMTTLLVTISGAIVGVIIFDKELNRTDLAPAILLIFLRIFGVLFSAKHYERFNFHIARVRLYRSALEKALDEKLFTQLRRDADAQHKGKFPWLVKQRQHRLWLILHGVNAAFGIALSAIIIIRWH